MQHKKRWKFSPNLFRPSDRWTTTVKLVARMQAGHKNESKMEAPISRRCLQRRTVWTPHITRPFFMHRSHAHIGSRCVFVVRSLHHKSHTHRRCVSLWLTSPTPFTSLSSSPSLWSPCPSSCLSTSSSRMWSPTSLSNSAEDLGTLAGNEPPTNCADVGTEPVSASLLQQHCKLTGLVFCWPWIPQSTARWRRAGDGAGDGAAAQDGCAMLSETIVLWTSLGLLTMNGSWQQLQAAKQGQGAKQWQNASPNFVNWLTPKLAITFRPHKYAMMRESTRLDALFFFLDKKQLADVLSQLCGTFRFCSRVLHPRCNHRERRSV